MSNIRILIVVDGIFNLTTTYPAAFTETSFGPDAWFTLSHLIATLRNAGFFIDTGSRGFNVAGNFDNGAVVNTVPDPNATLKGPDPANPIPFRFDDPSVDLLSYDQVWLFGFEGFDGPNFAVGPGTGEPGGITDSELAAITNFMQAGGGVFATGDHDGLGSALCGRIPRVRFMRKWYSQFDNRPGIPPLAVTNWPGYSSARVDTLQRSATDPSVMPPNFYFDDQSDDIPQKLNVLIPSHPAVQGATGVLTVYPDHMHEGEVIVPTGDQLTQTSASDPTLSFAGTGFTEFPKITGYGEPVVILATVTSGTPGPGGVPVGHYTNVAEGGTGPNCENKNFRSDMTVCDVKSNNTLAAYDGHTVNVGRIVTDSSFHHYLDLNLIGDPCSVVPVKKLGFMASPSGQAVLKELDAFYVNLANWLAWKDRKFYFVFGKNNYGRDEVNDSLVYPNAFYLFLEGFTPRVVASSLPTFSGSFSAANIPGLVITGPVVTYEVGNTGANANVTQRIRFEYGVQFSSASLTSAAFPSIGSATPNAFTLDAAIAIQGKAFSGLSAEFFLLGGDDPYFANVNASAGNRFFLSQDLRVFTITPTANNQTPIGNVPFTFQNGNPTTLDTAAGYSYIQNLVSWLNQNVGYKNAGYTPPDTNAFDPLNSLLPAQNGALNGDSSVTPFTGSHVNYNFAIARVRLKGASGPAAAAANVKVFFRAFTTQTFDTDYINTPAAVTTADPQVTFPSTGNLDSPQSPLPGTLGGVINGCSLPFFATANFANGGPAEYNAESANNHTIEIPSGREYTWAFYGCFLNVNDAANQYGGQSVQHWFAGSAHNCLVAQIAYPLAPIENANGVIANPEISDKLAQRNLQVTTSGNPGYPATHRVPQTIDVRPSPPAQADDPFSILSYPDEMMIDWGEIPRGSVASLYWPAVNVESVLRLASQLYPAHGLSAADANTIQCEVKGPVSYIPIPAGLNSVGDSFAGLLTVDLPASVRYGDTFDIVVRRITTRQGDTGMLSKNRGTERPAEAIGEIPLSWRYVTGSFLMKIPVQEESTILPGDENLLAVLKWRLGLIGPGNRWYPVLLRYIAYLGGRIEGMGGNPGAIPPSANGYHPPSKDGIHHSHELRYTGKVISVGYDRFGAFERFALLTERGHEHWFRGHEHEVEEIVRQAWMERFLISVIVEAHHPDWPTSFVLHRHR